MWRCHAVQLLADVAHQVVGRVGHGVFSFMGQINNAQTHEVRTSSSQFMDAVCSSVVTTREVDCSTA